jgi:hypothetical protein
MSEARDRMPEEAVRSKKVTIMLSPDELALVTRARGEMPRGAYVRMRLLEGVAADLGLDPGEMDTARRPAQRRRNYSERKQQGEGQE